MSIQWGIQDFPNGVGSANIWVWGEKLLFDKIFVENCMEMKQIGAPLDPPMRSPHLPSNYVRQ